MNPIIDINLLNLAGIILRLPGWFEAQYVIPLAGMMTGVILAGADPFTAIKYQIAIMIAIFSGTAITVFLAIRLTVANSFNAFGMLHPDILRDS